MTADAWGLSKTVDLVTPPKTNMSPKNQWLEGVFPIEIVPFRGHVSFPGCSW